MAPMKIGSYEGARGGMSWTAGSGATATGEYGGSASWNYGSGGTATGPQGGTASWQGGSGSYQGANRSGSWTR